MARPSTLDYNEIKREVELKGVDVIDVNTSSGRLAIYYKCTCCGKESKMNYVNYQKGQNSEFKCRECQKATGPKMERIKEYFKSLNVPITNVDVSKKHWEIYFPCSRCGKEVKILEDYVGKNNKELCCPNCRDNTRVPTKDEVEKEFTSRGSEMLSEYINFHTPIKFKCTKCGGVGEVDLAHLRNGTNTRLLCPNCNKPDSEGQLKKVLKEKHSELVGEFINTETPVEVTCTCCGKPFKFHFGNYKWCQSNPEILCPNCYTLARRKPVDPDVLKLRKSEWNTYVKEFFNIPRDDYGKYHAHHIRRVSEFPDERSSIVNGYPLIESEHHGAGRSVFYHSGEGTDIHNWGDVAKLPYHNYPGFKFNDFNSKFVTEIVNPTTSMKYKDLYRKKMEFFARGIFYMPLFPDDLSTELKRLLVYSMIRNRLYKDFSDVYEYTGSHIGKYYARKLEIKLIDKKQANSFFEMNHIHGAKGSGSKVNFGLVDKSSNALLCCMGFSNPRFYPEYDWEIDRFATRFDVAVIGGASRLFKHFIKAFDPNTVLSFCDIRFSSGDPMETVYPKLGFEYVQWSKSNYWYRDPKTNALSNRLNYQKSMLPDKLEKFDPKLSELENMEMNGFIQIFDCGNYKYVWTKK